MAYLVQDNQFTAQSVADDGINSGPFGIPNSGFGCSTVWMPNVDRIFMSPIDGGEGYANSAWRGDVDARRWGRYRPDPANARGTGSWQASLDNLHDYFGPAWGDNQAHVYHPTTGTVWRWGGNAGGNTGNTAIDPTWHEHYNPGFSGNPNPTAGV